MAKPKYSIGDKVEIINYGSLIWTYQISDAAKYPIIKEEGLIKWIDINPELVGATGIIKDVSVTQNQPEYIIAGIKGKHAWYHENQLKLISKNPNN